MLGEFQRINYIINNKYLFMCNGKTMEIFDLEKNMENIFIENDNVYEYEDGFFWSSKNNERRKKN